MTDFDYDFFVIGGGSGGVRASRVAAGLGARVGLAEERYLGGTCVNVGCVPKKLFSYASQYRQDFQDAKGYGWEFTEAPAFNWTTLRENKDREIARLNGIYLSMLQNTGVEVFQERATLLDKHTILLGKRKFTTKEILIATGGWPFVPDFPGNNHVISSNEIFSLAKLPASILIVGGGYIAVEFAGILAGLGVGTTLVSRGDRLLRGFDRELTDAFTLELKKYVTLRLNTQVKGIEKKDAGELLIHFDEGDYLHAEAVMYATGRLANTRDIGLKECGVALSDNGAVIVDDHFTTSIPNIHAVGDVIDRVPLTPVALAEGQILAQRLFGKHQKVMHYVNIPTAVFSHPNLASVGLDEEEARRKFSNVTIFRSRFTPLLHTLSGCNEKCFLKLVVDKDSDKVVGAHMLGTDAGEIIQGLAVAMTAGATKADFDATLGIHPTVAEEFVTMRTAS